ncbi:MAG: hypothetical protein B7Z63_04285, partial [Ignavibacteriae bacterium 37-53-5]
LMPDTIAEIKTFTSTGLTLSKTTVANLVTFTGVGNITTGTDTLIAPHGIGGSYGAGAYVDGNLLYNVTVTGAWIFPVGSGFTAYLPATLNFTALTGTGAVVVGAIDSTVIAPPPLSPGYNIKKLQHYYRIGNAAGITGFTATLTLSYTAADLASAGITNDSTLHVYEYNGSQWADLAISSRSVTNKTVTISGISSFGTFVLAEGPKKVTIAEARKDDNHDLIPDYKLTSDTLLVHGVITTPNLQGSSGSSYCIQDSTGGIDVFVYGTVMNFNIGDSVFAIGRITQYHGLTEDTLFTPDSVHFGLLKHGAVLPLAKQFALHEFVLNAEAYESQLVQVDSLYKVSGTWPAAGSYSSIYLTNAARTDTIQMYINKATNVAGWTEPTYPIKVVGVVSQYSSGSTVNAGYEIIPRDTNDIKRVVIAPPAAPTTLLPANGAQYQRVDTLSFKWNSSPTATKYLFQLSINHGFTSFVVNDSNVTDTTRKMTALSHLTKYFWRVSAYNAGGFGSFSAVDSFTTIVSAPAKPVLVSPRGTTGEPRKSRTVYDGLPGPAKM